MIRVGTAIYPNTDAGRTAAAARLGKSEDKKPAAEAKVSKPKKAKSDGSDKS